MTYGNEEYHHHGGDNYHILYEQVKLLEKIDKKLVVVIKKIEELGFDNEEQEKPSAEIKNQVAAVLKQELASIKEEV